MTTYGHSSLVLNQIGAIHSECGIITGNDWLHDVDPTSHGIALSDVAEEPTIYLIPECDTDEDVVEVLRELCDEIFEEQLDGWYRVPSSWPQDRSYEVFRQWFEYQHHSMLFDLCDGHLIRR